MASIQLRSGKTIFARWSPDGYYYPAVVGEVQEKHIRANFLDGQTAMVSKEHTIELQEAFKILDFEGNWKNSGGFYKGVITSHEPTTMNYDDGDVEQIDLKQLRGAKPGEATVHVPFNADGSKNTMALVGFILGCVSLFISFHGIVGVIAIIFSGIGFGTFNTQTQNNRWMAIAGLILGIGGIIWSLLFFSLLF